VTATRATAGTSAALLLSHWWSRPTDEERDVWAALWPSAHETADALGAGGEQVERLEGVLDGVDHERLLDEYERLLVGPGRPPCAPYESLWRGDLPAAEQGMLMGSAADAVATCYRELGLAARTDHGKELPDHLLLEWEAFAYALEQRAEDTAERLLCEHLARWIGPFCDAVTEHTDEPFYAALAGLTSAWTDALAA